MIELLIGNGSLFCLANEHMVQTCLELIEMSETDLCNKLSLVDDK
jgi:hypothetical protein